MKGAPVVAFAAVATLAGVARAEDLPDLLRPETLPELTHRFAEVTSETTLASVSLSQAVTPTGAVDTRQNETVRIESFSFEIPLASRNWFAGGSYAFAVGTLDQGGSLVVTGDPEAHVRGVWASVTGIAFGGGFGLVLPTGGWDGKDAVAVGTAAASVRAWDRAIFDPDSVTSRGFVDLRDAVGPLVVQYRQTLEAAVDTRNASNYTLAAVGTLYAGLRFAPFFSAGAQLVEYYSLEPDVSDATRAHWSLGADVRFITRYFQPMVAVMTSLGSPLRALSSIGSPLGASPESFLGVRLGLTFVLDTAQRSNR